MHLLTPLEWHEVSDIDLLIGEMLNFDILIDKRQVNQLLEMYEEKNTRLMTDVNMGEDDIVQINQENVLTAKRKLQEKIYHVNETIQILKRRKVELTRKNEFLNAPKRQSQKKKEA